MRKVSKGKFDLHVHTNFSRDGLSSVEQVLAASKVQGLNGLAITDHDVIDGALKALNIAEEYELMVIPGIEVTTKEGELLALGVTELVPPRLPAIDTVDRVRDLGGITVIPHPYDYGRSCVGRAAESLDVDAIEVLNGGEFLFFANTRAKKLARKRGLPMTAGSDAHSVRTVGGAYTLILEPVSEADEILQAVKNDKTLPVGKTTRFERIREYAARRKKIKK